MTLDDLLGLALGAGVTLAIFLGILELNPVWARRLALLSLPLGALLVYLYPGKNVRGDLGGTGWDFLIFCGGLGLVLGLPRLLRHTGRGASQEPVWVAWAWA